MPETKQTAAKLSREEIEHYQQFGGQPIGMPSAEFRKNIGDLAISALSQAHKDESPDRSITIVVGGTAISMTAREWVELARADLKESDECE